MALFHNHHKSCAKNIIEMRSITTAAPRMVGSWSWTALYLVRLSTMYLADLFTDLRASKVWFSITSMAVVRTSVGRMGDPRCCWGRRPLLLYQTMRSGGPTINRSGVSHAWDPTRGYKPRSPAFPWSGSWVWIRWLFLSVLRNKQQLT